jgi:hypothetical protein
MRLSAAPPTGSGAWPSEGPRASAGFLSFGALVNPSQSRAVSVLGWSGRRSSRGTQTRLGMPVARFSFGSTGPANRTRLSLFACRETSTAVGKAGLRTLAPTSQPLCAGCELPSTDIVCSHLSHPRCSASRWQEVSAVEAWPQLSANSVRRRFNNRPGAGPADTTARSDLARARHVDVVALCACSRDSDDRLPAGDQGRSPGLLVLLRWCGCHELIAQVVR